MPQSHPLHHMRRYCFWLITKTTLVANHPFPTGFSSYVNLREDFSHPNKNANSQQSLCASWYGWHHRKEAPESFGANCPVHGTYLNPNWDLYKVFKETAGFPFYRWAEGKCWKNRNWCKTQFFHTTFRRAMRFFPSQNGVQYPTLQWEKRTTQKWQKGQRVKMLCF